MACELDHFFICTDIGAPEADRLKSFGLAEGKPNTHPGQGSTNRRFFFHNFMLELLWVHDASEAQSEVIQPIHLWERWVNRNSGACPFGFCFRPTVNSSGELPFSAWEYRPPYLPKSLSCSVATNSEVLTEPMLFYLSFAQRQDAYPADKLPPLQHDVNLREVTRVEFVTPYVNHSSKLQAVINANLLTTRLGEEYFVTLGFDGEMQGQQIDFRPGLPLVFCW